MQTITSRKLYGKLNSFMGTMRDGTVRKMVEGQQALIGNDICCGMTEYSGIVYTCETILRWNGSGGRLFFREQFVTLARPSTP